MYHQEKVINGVLCYKIAPDTQYKPYTLEQLTDRVIRGEKIIQNLMK